MTHLTSSKRHTLARTGAALFIVLAMLPPLGSLPAEARIGGGSSFGSRGTRTFSAPPMTRTAPGPAAPMQRTETPRIDPSPSGFAAPRRFGFGSGLAAGLVGAGLFGMLTGHGFFGGLGGIASMFGFLLQIVLIVLAVRFAITFFRNRRSAPAYAGAGGPMPKANFWPAGMSRGGSSGPAPEALTIGEADFAAFERLLSDLQHAYGREDTNALSRLTTPEMLRHLGADLEANRSRGVRNDLSDVRLLQGDLAESWRENRADYATVAMRFSARDTMVDRVSGRVVSGDPARPVEATELWTFRRDGGEPWQLSAIQQAG